MKIAITTEDKSTLCEHFGGAPYFVVITVEDDKVANKEIRDKPGHKEWAGEEGHPQTGEEGTHGYGPEAKERHKKIYSTIEDCDVIITAMIGQGAYEDMKGFGIEVIACDEMGIDEAVSLYLDGKLSHNEARVGA